MNISRSVFVVFLLFPAVPPAYAQPSCDSYHDSLKALAVWCENQGLAAEAKTTRAAVKPDSPDHLFLPALPLEAGLLSDDDSLREKGSEAISEYPSGNALPVPGDDHEDGRHHDWHRRFSRIRRTYAEQCFAEARRLAGEKKGGKAVEYLLECVRANPDHLGARTVFGFQRYEGTWRTAWEIGQLKKKRIDHPRFGWIPAAHVKRYEKGERFLQDPDRRKGEWISSEEEERRRFDIRNGWVLVSEHYELRTNVGLEEGVKMLRRLEDIHRAWSLLFFRYLGTEGQFAKMFLNLKPGVPSQSGNPKKHSVYVYRDKEDYVRNLQEIDPNIGNTIGFYLPSKKRCYFYPPDPAKMSALDVRNIDNTLLHEATHQLFQESRGIVGMPGESGNFWIFEGIAMYMETLRRSGDYYVLGECGNGLEEQDAARAGVTADTSGRLYAARYRYHEGFYVPMAILVRMNTRLFQEFRGYPRPGSDPLAETQKLYSQSAGFTHFLMHAEGGRFREAVIAYLCLFYNGEAVFDTLSKLTGVSYPELDRMYDVYIRQGF